MSSSDCACPRARKSSVSTRRSTAKPRTRSKGGRDGNPRLRIVRGPGGRLARRAVARQRDQGDPHVGGPQGRVAASSQRSIEDQAPCGAWSSSCPCGWAYARTHTTEYDGGAPDERGAESAESRRPQNLI